jgi:mono/diheme cytochrome c family protein
MKKLSIILVIIAMVIFQETNAQDGEMLFKSSCAACHSIGKGRLLGPDLKGITSTRNQEWLIKFIKSSKSMIDANDKDAVAIAKEFNNFMMPDSPLNEAEIKAILSYIRLMSGDSSPAQTMSADTTKTIEEAIVIIGDAGIGKDLFEGRYQFSAKGVACLACHGVDLYDAEDGGLLAKNLTHSFATLGSEAAITGILSSPPFPYMQAAYKNNMLTTQEMAHITAYLKKTSDQKYSMSKPLFSRTFLAGIFLTTLLFFMISTIWRKRKSGSVNESIMNRQIR